jgi:hypothetical protein
LGFSLALELLDDDLETDSFFLFLDFFDVDGSSLTSPSSGIESMGFCGDCDR